MDLAFNKKSSLEQQFIDIKHMTNSVNILNILKECDKVNKNLLSETGNIENIIDEIKNNKEDMKDKFSLFDEYSTLSADSEELEKELQMMIETPMKSNKDIIDEKNRIDPNIFPNVESGKKSESDFDKLINEFRNY